MGTRTSYPPGTFSWVDLATTDVAAAKKFYSGLFGWQTDDDERSNGAVSTTCRIDGDAVCGLRQGSDEMRAGGAPSTWTSYVTVVDADAGAARAKELGGSVASAAVDVSDLGRMAIVRDPRGASLALWQPGARFGAERVNDVGCLVMNELATPDPDAVRPFYEDLFGWATERIDTGPQGPPTVFAYVDGRLNASFAPPAEGAVAPHWRPYFTVESTEDAITRVRDLGGRELLGSTPNSDGSIAIGQDPQGAVFAFYTGDADP
jgi:predicted enzyme related to lactoylglutathione lyase